MAKDTGYNLRRQFGDNMLEGIIDWIRDNLEPEIVFNHDQLADWAKNQAPDDVCEAEELEKWALDNDFSKEAEAA